MNDEHWITEETLKAMMINNGHPEKNIKSLEPDLIEYLLDGIDHYGNLGADLGTAYYSIMEQLARQLKSNVI